MIRGPQYRLDQLAVPASLWFFIAKVRTCVPRLERRRWSMFNETPANTCRLLEPQRHVPFTLIDKVVHFFGHNISRFAKTGKHTNIFQQWRDHKVVPARPTVCSNTSTKRRHLNDSGAMMSRIPGLVLNSGAWRGYRPRRTPAVIYWELGSLFHRE